MTVFDIIFVLLLMAMLSGSRHSGGGYSARGPMPKRMTPPKGGTGASRPKPPPTGSKLKAAP